jgi:YidC/Oxa1 family membrane protein insertase
MDNIRLILLLSLGAVLFLIYQAWIEDYGPSQTPSSVADRPAVAAADGNEGAPGSQPDGPPADAPDAPPVVPMTQPAEETAEGAVAASAGLIEVDTDTVRAQISPIGGTIQSMWLKHYAEDADRPDDPLRLLKPEPPNMFLAQSGLLGGPDGDLPTHKARFTAQQDSYRLEDGADALTVELTWSNGAGIDVIKRYRFERGSYLIHAEQEVINDGTEPLGVRGYDQLQRTELYDPDKSSFIHTYTGAVYYGPDAKYKKESFSDIAKAPLKAQITEGWVAMIQHYFMAAWIPPAQIEQTFYTKAVGGDRYIIGAYSPSVAIPPGGSHLFSSRLFAGPKLQDTLSEITPGLELAVDYGWLTILAEPIFWLLDKIHAVVGNWGWAIIILTILIKLAFYKLSETSYKSMANMRKLAPRLQALKDRYGDDKERLNQAMMEMYKKEKINPLGGCLPILVQIPVFIALYWVLLESVELRHAPFVLWLDNLTEPDPYYVLPLIMGVSMFVQQKLNPPPPDPVQAKVLMALPFVFTVFFAFFPSGLVLYWTVNQLLSIAQQWHITHRIEKAEAAKRNR